MFAQSNNKKKLLTSLLPLTLFCQNCYADFGVMPTFAAAHGVALQTPYNSASMFQGFQKPDVCYAPSPIMPSYESSFIDFSALTRVGKKELGGNGGEYAGVYKTSGETSRQETYYVKDPSFTGDFLNEYLAGLFLQEFYPQGSAVVKLIKGLPGYVASRELKGFVPFKNLDHSTLKGVSLQSSIDLCMARNILGLWDVNDGNAGVKNNEDGSAIAAGIDYDGSFISVNDLQLSKCENVVNIVLKDKLLSAYKSFMEKYRRDFFEQSFANIKYFLEKHFSNFDCDKFNDAKKAFFSNYQELQNIVFLNSNNITSTHLHKLDWLKQENITENMIILTYPEKLKFLHELGWLKPEHVTAGVVTFSDVKTLKFFHELGWLKPEHVTEEHVITFANLEKLKFLHELGCLKPEHVTAAVVIYATLEKLKFLHELGWLKPEHVTAGVVIYATLVNLKFLHSLGWVKLEHVTAGVVERADLDKLTFLHSLGWVKPEHVTEDVVIYATLVNLKFLHELGWLKPEHLTESVVFSAALANIKFLHGLGLLKPEHLTQDVLKYVDLERLRFFHELGLLKPAHMTESVVKFATLERLKFFHELGLLSWYNPFFIWRQIARLWS